MTTTAEKWKALGKLNKQVQKCHIEMENMASELGTESLIQFYLHGLGNMTRMVSVAIDAAANENTSLDEDDPPGPRQGSTPKTFDCWSGTLLVPSVKSTARSWLRMPLAPVHSTRVRRSLNE